MIRALDDFSISLYNKLYKNKVGFIIIFLAISPKWPFEISKIAKFTAKLFILLKANFRYLRYLSGVENLLIYCKIKTFLLSFKDFKKILQNLRS